MGLAMQIHEGGIATPAALLEARAAITLATQRA